MSKETIINKLTSFANEANYVINYSKDKDKTLAILGISSLAAMGLIVKMEQELNVRIPDEKLNKITTLDQLVNVFLKLTNEQ